jgi:hypothetical protein
VDQALRQRLRKIESGNKKNAIENRRLARENIELISRIEKLEKALQETDARSKANEKLLKRVHAALVKAITVIKRLRVRLAAVATRAKAKKKAKAAPRKKKAAATRR